MIEIKGERLIGANGRLLALNGGKIFIEDWFQHDNDFKLVADFGGILHIGHDNFFNRGVVIGAYKYLKIGNSTLWGEFSGCRDHNHNYGDLSRYIKHQGSTGEYTEIGSGVWVGRCSSIMAGCRVGDNSIIAANSCVTKDVPPYAIVGGVPAKVIGMRSENGFQRIE